MMDRKGGIRVFEDEGFKQWATAASLAVLVAGGALGWLWFARLRPAGWGGTDLDRLDAAVDAGLEASEGLGEAVLAVFSPMLIALLGVALACVAAFALHELVHAAFFKLFSPAGTRVGFGANWKAGMIYASAEGVVYSRRQYQVIAIAPTFAVSALTLALGALLGLPVAAWAVFVLHLSGCVGDWGYLLELRRQPDVDRCVDAAWGVRFLHEGEPIMEEDDMGADDDSQASLPSSERKPAMQDEDPRRVGSEQEGEDSPQGRYLALGMSVGMSLGCAFGTVLNNLAMGVAVGLAVGAALGLAMGGAKGGEK